MPNNSEVLKTLEREMIRYSEKKGSDNKKFTLVTFRSSTNKDLLWFGVSRCNYKDTFNKERGKLIARHRAILAAESGMIPSGKFDFKNHYQRKDKNYGCIMVSDIFMLLEWFYELK